MTSSSDALDQCEPVLAPPAPPDAFAAPVELQCCHCGRQLIRCPGCQVPRCLDCDPYRSDDCTGI